MADIFKPRRSRSFVLGACFTFWVIFLLCSSVSGDTSNVVSQLELDAKRYEVAIKNVLPVDWSIFSTKVARCPWFKDRFYINIELGYRKALGSGHWAQCAVLFLPRDYHPLSNGVYVCVPFPLFGQTPLYQVFAWGDPAELGWSSALTDIVGSLSLVTDMQWCPVDSTEFERLARLSQTDKKKKPYYEHWKEQVMQLRPFVVGLTNSSVSITGGREGCREKTGLPSLKTAEPATTSPPASHPPVTEHPVDDK